MTPEQFAYWLQGFAEIHGDGLTEQQWRIIRDHLKTVFHKVTPQYVTGPQFPSSQPTPGPFTGPQVIC